MDAEGDRLSSLSDDLIIKILSYIDTKHAIKISILSSRWKNTWKSIRHLDLSTDDFTSLNRFHEFTRVFSSCNNEIELSSVKLTVRGGFYQVVVKKVINYAFLHNVQKMTIICLDKKRTEIPLSLFISQSLKDLTLVGSTRYYCFQLDRIKSSWDLPALTTLQLDHVMFVNERSNESGSLFSKCPNLKNLTFSNCMINDHNHYTISHPQLSNLTLKNGDYSAVNVVASHLKNLTVVNCRGDLMISAPELSSLMYKNTFYLPFLQDCLSSLEKVDFYIYHSDGPSIIDILQQFPNVKYLTLGLEIAQEKKALQDATLAQQIMATLQEVGGGEN
ncbi:putative FBD-associated F-box protein At5g22720 [Rutidosis leptorrhynchoides]|uniref:putative FBD-associated F-box protein At5g22720 n=1 Tax=Rutidosis leptorrhynchoides TaxID=125765 RepID=UPI003A9A068B